MVRAYPAADGTAVATWPGTVGRFEREEVAAVRAERWAGPARGPLGHTSALVNAPDILAVRIENPLRRVAGAVLGPNSG